MKNSPTAPSSDAARRAGWMRVLALAEPAELARACAGLQGLPAHQWLRRPETGMAMVRARSGGDGARFNLGEMTLTRCTVALADGPVGVAYVQGRDPAHAERAALLDGLMQLPAWHDRIQAEVIDPLARARAARLADEAGRTAQSRVDFFTLVRGED